MNIRVESLPGKEHQVEEILTQIIKEMFIGLHGAQPHIRHAGREAGKNRGNAERQMHCRSRPFERCAKAFSDRVRRRAADPQAHA